MFTLRNRPLGTIAGEAVAITAAGAGGTMRLRLPDGTEQDVTYAASGEFVVDGLASTEGELETAFSAGDRVTIRPADSAASQAQQVVLESLG